MIIKELIEMLSDEDLNENMDVMLYVEGKLVDCCGTSYNNPNKPNEVYLWGFKNKGMRELTDEEWKNATSHIEW